MPIDQTNKTLFQTSLSSQVTCFYKLNCMIVIITVIMVMGIIS